MTEQPPIESICKNLPQTTKTASLYEGTGGKASQPEDFFKTLNLTTCCL